MPQYDSSNTKIELMKSVLENYVLKKAALFTIMEFNR